MRPFWHSEMVRFFRDERGVTAMTVAIAMFSMVAAAAVSIDSSMFFVQKRKLQSAVDFAAIAAVAASTDATGAARRSLASNGITPIEMTVGTGTYDPTRALGSRYQSDGAATNAVSVTAAVSAPMIFGQIFAGSSGTSAVTIGATGRAARVPSATFSIGSRLAGLNGGVANAVLSGLSGGHIALTAADYESLTNANVDVGAFTSALAAAAGITGGTYADLLGARLSPSQVISALAASGVDTKTAAALSSILNALPRANGTVTLGGLIDLGPYDNQIIGTDLRGKGSVNVYDAIAGAIGLSSGGTPVSVDLGPAVPGLTGASLVVSVSGGPPSTVIAPFAQTTTATARQIHLELATSTAVAGIGTVRLPVVLDAAKATAVTQGPTCASGAPTLALAVTPPVTDLVIGGTGSAPAPIATVLGISVSAYSRATSSNAAPVQQTFTSSDVTAMTVKTTSSGDPIVPLMQSALSNVRLSGSVLGLTVPLPSPTVLALTSALNGLAGPTDTLIDMVARTLGVGVGQADTWVSRLTCGQPALVN